VRIALIVTRADPIGGAQIHVRDLASALRAHGHSPTVLTGGGGPLIQTLGDQGVPTVLLRHLSAPIAPVRDLRALAEIRSALAALTPDIIATHSSKAGVLGRLAARSLGIPVVFTAHGWSFTPGIPSVSAALYRRIERMVGALSSRIITVSEFDRRLALEAHIALGDRIVTIHNGSPDTAPGLRADPGRDPVRLAMIARFEAQKDHATLLRALGGLTQYAWTLDLIGNGPLMGAMQALASQVGIAERVSFLGQRMDVPEILAQSQVSLLVTNWEGFPLSILESMRAGLPVIASDVGGIVEAVSEGETGYVVPRGAVELLQRRIASLLSDSNSRKVLGANGRARFEQQFTLEQSVEKTLSVYRDVLAGS
jgi:glycosyltransferase involved in cell wall biosynthesis